MTLQSSRCAIPGTSFGGFFCSSDRAVLMLLYEGRERQLHGLDLIFVATGSQNAVRL